MLFSVPNLVYQINNQPNIVIVSVPNLLRYIKGEHKCKKFRKNGCEVTVLPLHVTKLQKCHPFIIYAKNI